MPRARRAAGYMSPAAVRMSSETALAAPMSPNPAMTAGVESTRVASAVSAQPAAPSTNPTVITGVRPKRSIIRPAGTDVSAEAVRKIAGPSPTSPRTPVTSTNVSDDTAATSCSTAEFTAIVAASRMVLRRMGSAAGFWLATAPFNQAAPAALLLQLLREACGKRRFAHGRARRLWLLGISADHGRRRADVRARRLHAGPLHRGKARRAVVSHRPAVGRAAHALSHRQRAAHRRAPDHRAQRPRHDYPPASEAAAGRRVQAANHAADAGPLPRRRRRLPGVERTAAQLPATPVDHRAGRRTAHAAPAVPAGHDRRRLPLRAPRKAESTRGASELLHAARDSSERNAGDLHSVVRSASARDLLPCGHAGLLSHARLLGSDHRLRIGVRVVARGRPADPPRRPSRRCAPAGERDVAALPPVQGRRPRADRTVHPGRQVIRRSIGGAGTVVLVVLLARSLAYATVPDPSARFLAHRAGGPALPVLALVALGLGAVLALAICSLVAVAVRERALLERRDAERFDVVRTLALAVLLTVTTCFAGGMFEAYLHWRAGLGWHGLHCLVGPVHRDLIPFEAGF